MLNEVAIEYIEHDLAVLPVKGKRPYHPNWYNKDFSNHKRWTGIGLKCGEASGIICLDIDTLDAKVKEKVLKVIPPLFSGKLGNPNKLPSYFFRYNGEQSTDFKNIEVQILSTGKQTVLPPSPHPEYTKFTWVGRPLDKIDRDDLPILSKEVIEKLELLDDQQHLPQTSKGVKTSGRNNRLKDQVVAGLTALGGKSVDVLVEEIIEYDKVNHTPPLFEDTTEPYMNKTPYENALAFVSRITASLHRNKQISLQQPCALPVVSFKDGDLELDLNQQRFKKLPKLIGLGAEIFDDFYKNAPIPRSQFAYMNTLSLLSTLLCNHVSYVGTLPNLYCYGIAPSGFGKDFPFRRVQKILAEAELGDLIGLGSLHSETVLLKYMTRKRACLFPINEGEKIIKGIADKNRSFGLGESLTDIFDSSGRQYVPKGLSGQKGELEEFGKIFSPYLVITMLSSDTGFQDNVNMSLFETGLLSRFLLFVEDRFKRQRFISNYNPEIPPALIARVKSFYQVGRSKKPLVEDASVSLPIHPIKTSQQSERFREGLFNSYQDDLAKDDVRFRGLMQRRAYHAHKLALIHHSLLFEETYPNEPIQLESIEWGYETAKTIHHNSIRSMSSIVNEGGSDERLNKKILDYIKKREKEGKTTTKKDISNAMRGSKKNRDTALAELLDRGSVVVKNRFFGVGLDLV